MVQFTKAFLIAAIVASPVLSTPVRVNERELVTRDPGNGSDEGALVFRRELDDSLDARELIDELELDARDDLFETRELSGEDLVARDPSIFGKIFGAVKGIFSRDLEDMIARDLYDDLAARGVVPELETRELSGEDLVARDPSIFGKIFGAVKGIFSRDVEDMVARDVYDDFAARGLLPEIETRELSGEDLIARDPSIFGKIFGAVKGIFSRDVEDMIARDLYDDLSARGLVPELETRELSSDELVARDPSIFGKIFGAVKGIFSRELEALETRELSSEDLVARDPSIFGKIFGAVKGIFSRDIDDGSFDELD
jgi:hypothetical protein